MSLPDGYSDAADLDTASDDYARRFAGPVGAYFLEVQSRAVLELLRGHPGASILDVGGGHAQIAEPLLAHGFRMTVVGSSDDCRARLDRFLPPGSFRFQRADLLRLPFPDASFDVVVALRLISHVVRWPTLIEEMCRVAGRAVVLDYPDRRSFNAFAGLFFAWKKKAEGNTRRYRTFSRAELVAHFARHGFGRPRSQPQFFLPMVLHRVVGLRPVTVGVEAASRAVGATRWFGSPVVLRVERLRPRARPGPAGGSSSRTREAR